MRGIRVARIVLAGWLVIAHAIAGDARARHNGLSIDGVAICRDRVLSAAILADPDSGMLGLTIRLDAHGQAALAASTQRLVHQELIIRIGERIVASPLVVEPILAGELVINGADRSVLKATRRAALARC